MTFCIIHHCPGGTEKQYDATLRAVHGSDTELPEGQIFHAAGPSGDGWTVVAIHDSEASWNEFRDQVLTPRLQAGVAGGLCHAAAGIDHGGVQAPPVGAPQRRLSRRRPLYDSDVLAGRSGSCAHRTALRQRERISKTKTATLAR